MITSQNRYVRGMIISLVVIGLCAFIYINLDEEENFQLIITFVVGGLGLGLLILNIFGWIRSSRK